MTANLRFSLPTPEECGIMDRLAADRPGLETLMERAGWSVAQAIRSRWMPCRVLVLCGPGNNGGDGYVAARFLERAGWPVSVAALAQPQADSGAARAAACFRGLSVAFTPENAARFDLVIDAVFGAGLNRAPSADIMAVLNAARRVVAIDIPSGVDGRTGAILAEGPDCLLTVTFVRPKPGHILHPGAGRCGERVCADIGMPRSCLEAAAPRHFLNEPGLWSVPAMTPESYKYSRGVVSLCGGHVMPGAARLAAAAARKTGAGLVRISAGHAAEAYRTGAPGLVVDEAPLAGLLEDERRKVWICGPGLTEPEVDASLSLLIGADRIVLADAGALAWAAGRPETLRGVAVITPHIGEFTRLFGAPGQDRVKAVCEAACLIDAVIVLKGPVTVIASPDGRVALNEHASPALATAGSGDTLSGIIAALLAAGMAPWEAACAGVWIHGEAGLCAGNWPIVEELDAHLGNARAKAIALAC